MSKKTVLQTNPNFTFSLNTQIKEQLKWLIGTGAIQPGEFLPPASELADMLHVNRNTVNLVYTQLRDEGIVSIQKGRGTQVIGSPVVENLKRNRTAMRALLDRTFTEAQEEGIGLYELAAACYAYVLLMHTSRAHKGRILFIECRGHDHPFYKAEIERLTGAEVRVLLLEDIAADQTILSDALRETDCVISTLNHADEVKALLPPKSKPLHMIGASADIALLLDLAKLKSGSKVAFACLGKQGGQWMLQRVKEAGIHQIEGTTVGMDNAAAISQAVRQSDLIYASSAVYDELKLLAPGRVKLYPLILERSSETLLKDLSLS